MLHVSAWVTSTLTTCRWPSGNWSWREDLNLRQADYKSATLPTELHQHNGAGGAN